MNTGIGDAVNLAWKLAAALRGSATESLLDSYEPERISFARRLVATTDRVFTIATKRGPVAARVRRASFRSSRPHCFVCAWCAASCSGSQLGVNYRASPLSAGTAGGIRGGDRLPWIQTAPHEDNLAALTSLSWQVHVYGEPAAPRGRSLCQPPASSPCLCVEVRNERVRLHALGALSRPVRGYIAVVDVDGDPEILGDYFMKRGLVQNS
jgi:FAD binding domain